MTTGRIDYSPDYKLITEVVFRCPNCGNPDCAEEFRAKVIKETTERARLERAIVEAAKQWATLRYQPHFGGMIALEDTLQKATHALIEFESLQEKK